MTITHIRFHAADANGPSAGGRAFATAIGMRVVLQ